MMMGVQGIVLFPTEIDALECRNDCHYPHWWIVKKIQVGGLVYDGK